MGNNSALLRRSRLIELWLPRAFAPYGNEALRLLQGGIELDCVSIRRIRSHQQLVAGLAWLASDGPLGSWALACIMHEKWNSDRIVDRAKHNCDKWQNLT